MTSSARFASLVDAGSDLPGELVDALIEVVVRPRDSHARSCVVCSLVQEICASVEWLHFSDDDASHRQEDATEELVSLRQVAAAAQDHRSRMAPGGSIRGDRGTS
jgi:hypothetical protein